MLPRGQYIIGMGFHTLLSQVLLNVQLWKLEGKLPSQSNLVFTAFLSLVALWMITEIPGKCKGYGWEWGLVGFFVVVFN